MRLLTWNIRHGGSNASFDSIINSLLEHESDVIVLTEFWDNAKGHALSCTEKLVELHGLGWIDTWRFTHKKTNECSWRNILGDGFRIDHAYISPMLEQNLLQCYFSHQERLDEVSNHSVLIVDLKV